MLTLPSDVATTRMLPSVDVSRFVVCGVNGGRGRRMVGFLVGLVMECLVWERSEHKK